MAVVRCIELEKLPNGNLRLTLNDEGREEIADMDVSNKSSEDILLDLLEYDLCNGWNVVPPEQLCALTDAILLTDDLETDDNGDITRCGRVYKWDMYMVLDPIEELLTVGSMEWDGHE